MFKRWVVARIIYAVKSEWPTKTWNCSLRLRKTMLGTILRIFLMYFGSAGTTRQLFSKIRPWFHMRLRPMKNRREIYCRIFSCWNPFSSTTSTLGNNRKPIITFQPFFGDPRTAAIFRRIDRPEIELPLLFIANGSIPKHLSSALLKI